MSLLVILCAFVAVFITAYLTIPRVKYYVKCIIYIFNFLFISLGSVIIILISKLTPYPQDGSVIRPVFSKYWQIITGFSDFEIEGKEYLEVDGKGTRPCVFMYNHQSSLYMLMM